MSELQRIVLTGDMPWPVPGQPDWADELARAQGISYESVVHLPGGLFDDGAVLSRIASMQEFVVTAPLKRVPGIFAVSSVTDLYIIEPTSDVSVPKRLLRRRLTGAVSRLATEGSVRIHPYNGRSAFDAMLHSELGDTPHA